MRALGVGLAHAEVMERLSERIESSAQESQLIEQIKRNYADPAQTVIDDGIDLLIQIVQDTRDWSKDRQWEFVKFLTGQVLFVWDQATLDYLRQLSLTPAMIRKRFTILPNHYQYKIVDALLSQDGGLLASFDKSNRWVETIMQFFVDQVGSEAQTVARELFDAYAHALDTPGLRPFRSSLFARLLVSSTSENKSGQVVAQLCQHFGAFGIKLGQFLLATQILPPAENEALRDLEDSARAPTREEVYEDLRSIYGAQQVPYTVKRVLGGASLKYVVLATSPIGREVVLKVLARDAMIHTPLEAKIASRMGDYLVRKHGPKYSVFNTVIDAAAQAVKRELSFADEVERSKLARAHMYKTGALHPSIKLHMADEVLINNRLIEAEYVAGTAIYELDEAAQKSVAENLNQMEWDNFMGDEHAEKVYFDPDRHFGNYRMTAEQIAPIDFGQLHVLSIEQREQIMNVAAIAGILNEMARRSSWYVSYKASALADELQRVLALPPDSARQSLLTKQIKTEFASPKDNDIAAFYALLGALDQAGMFASIDRIPFYDVPKGLLQLSRLGEYLGEEFKSTTASERFKALVTKRAHAIAEALQLGH